MTEDKNRFAHDRSPYERPNFPFRCGREAAFGKPCPRGPSAGGDCQGISDCTPFRTRKVVTNAETGEETEIQRWECRRPQHAGGPCAEGPRPDGTCSCIHPPCAPKPTIRRQRGRWAMLAVAAMVAMALAFVGAAGGIIGPKPDADGILSHVGWPSSVNPGPLSGKHEQFTAKDGCISCHVGHSDTLTGWAGAIFKRTTISDSCVSCHSFGEKQADADPKAQSPMAFAAHNTKFPNRTDAPTATCTGCHTEHKGVDASITPMEDGQCSACHTTKFDSFSKSHPKFGANFPHESARTIKFPHGKHLETHFVDQRYIDKAPKNGCVSCHTDQVDGRLLPGSFENGCAACHEVAIKEQGMAVFGLPELSDPELTAEARDSCGFPVPQLEPARATLEALAEALPTMQALGENAESGNLNGVMSGVAALGEAQAAIAEAQEELAEAVDMSEAVSLDSLSPIAAFLLAVPADDADEYSESAAAFLIAAAAEGQAPLAEAIDAKGGDANVLLSGLSPELVTEVTCAWAANTEYEPKQDPEPGAGWTAQELQVSYLPTGHADAVTKGWIALGLANRGSEDEGAEAFAELMLSASDGPGRCFKCHVAPAADAEKQAVQWAIPRRDIRPFTAFNHDPHLNVLDQGAGCATCHRQVEAGATLADGQSRPGPHANDFKPIDQATCKDCHRPGGVRQDCALCHRYHSNPSIRKRTM